jgi:hypothetical protein
MWSCLLGVLVSALDYSSCAAITCEQTVVEGDYCIYYNAKLDSVYLNYVDCVGGCNFSQLYLKHDNTYFSDPCITPNETGHPTGHPCTQPSNCSSNICSVPVCYGVPEGAYCYDSEACLPGFYCDNNICSASKADGDSCDIHEECPIGYGCDRGSCTLLFSKDQGESTSDKKLCKSNFMYKGKCDSLLIYVFDEELSPPFNCKVDETCVYKTKKTGEVWAELPCTCAGLSKKGGGYCSYFAENTDKVVNDHYVYLTYTYSTCGGNWTHTDDPDILYRCGSITDDQYWYFHNLVGRSRYLAVYQSGAVDDCAEHFEFFNLTYSLGAYTYSAYLRVLGFIIMSYLF